MSTLDNLTAFSERLKALRKNHGLTQKELAESVGMTAASFSAYENGTKTPSLSVAVALSEVYNVSLDWLVGKSAQEEAPIESDDYETLLGVLALLIDNDRIINVTISREDEYSYPTLEVESYALKGFIVSVTRYQGLLKAGDITEDEYSDLVNRSVERRASELREELKGQSDSWSGASY